MAVRKRASPIEQLKTEIYVHVGNAVNLAIIEQAARMRLLVTM